MKKINTILFLLFTFSAMRITAQDLADLDTYEKSIKAGTELTYDVSANGKQYKMMITLKKVGTDISFDWKTTDPDNKSGSVTMNANAMSAAKAFSHFFTGTTSLDNATSLWASKVVCNEIMTNAQVLVKVTGTSDTSTMMYNTMGLVNLNLNGNGVGLSGWELQGGTPVYTIGIIESVKFPLIYKLDLGALKMTLTDIKI